MWSAPRLAAFVSLAALIGCSKPPAASPEPPPAPVTVAAAATKTVPLQLRTIGSVKALATVAVRPRVGGELTGVFFTEGQYVTKKQKLFTIDRRPYDAAVKLATANKAKNVALLEGAKVDLKRAEQAKAGGVAAAAEYDAALTAVDSAKAAIEADEAAINAATIQAGYTTIISPIDGRVGELLVTPGNVVDANDINPLVVINQIRPISVAFTLPEHQLPVVLAARDRAKDPLKVEAAIRGGGQPVVGDLTFVDNAADPQTGTVQFKATFENADDRLWPGLFVDVVLTLGQRERSVVVPTAAVQTGQKGQYVYVVTAEKKAELKPVRVAFETGGEAVVESGLDGGETVVVEGQLRLAPGTKVAPKPATPAPPGPASAPRVSTGDSR